MKQKRTPITVIKRLPRYYRYLGDLLDKGIIRISSKELSEQMGITASQIRQDLNNFGTFGQQGYGYNVENLYKEIKKILGLDKTYKIIVIGAGHIGRALASYSSFATRGFCIEAFFDIDEKIIGKSINGTPILDFQNLPKYLKENTIDIAILTVPNSSALEVAQILEQSPTLKGIWNFTGVDLKLPEHITVENVRLTDSLMTLSYRFNEEDIFKRVMKI